MDVHISLQSDISMPLAISALQKQIKKYLEACSGVMVQEVRVFVDSTIPADEQTGKSPYAIPNALLGLDAEPLPHAQSDQENAQEEKETVLTQESESEPALKQSEEEPAEQKVQTEEAEEQGEQA